MKKSPETKAPVTKTIVIHSFDHARAALAAAREARASVMLLSAEAAAGNAGPLWFIELVKAAKAEFPGVKVESVLDCGDAPGYALAALRAGCKAIRFSGSRPATAKMINIKIKAIARQSGAVLYAKRPPALDLDREPDPLAACRKWLGKPQKRRQKR